MIQKFLTWVRGVFAKMMHINDAKRALNVDVAISAEMQQAIDLWAQMFVNRAPWLDDTTQSLGLPAAIAGEIARLVTVEMESSISGSRRADYLAGEYARVKDSLRGNVELAAASGGIAFKPYVDGRRILVDCVPAWRFFPTDFNALGEVTGAVFVERAVRGKIYYTRMEYHKLTDDGYTIRNAAFHSMSEGSLGAPCGLDAVDEWASLEAELTIRYKDGKAPERALFAYFRMPLANTIEPESPLGVSAYSRATGLIKEADRQYSRILWEYEGSELAVDASDTALRMDGTPGGAMPIRNKRLFRQLGLDKGTGGDLYEVFSPAIRDGALFNGLNQLLKRIEFNCNLAYGTLSDPQNVDKTAEEIRSSKQRSYSAICDIQKALQGALEHLLWAMDLYASLHNLAPRGAYEVSFTFGDGVLEDADKEYARRADLADRGYLKPEKLIGWYFGVSDEEALAYMPDRSEGLELR